MNKVRINAEYLHVPSGTKVKVMNTCVINKEFVDDKGEYTTVPEDGVMFVPTENVGKETPRVLSEKEFNEVFVPVYLQAGMKVLMIAMGKVVGETEVEDTEDKGLVRLKHAGELVRRSLDKNGNLNVIYLPEESQGYVFTALEITAAAAERRKVLDAMIKDLNEFRDRIDQVGELHRSNIALKDVYNNLKRRIARTSEELGL